MKKSKKIKIAVGVLASLAIITAVSSVGYNHYNKFLASNNDGNENDQNDQNKTKKLIEESISKEESDKAKQELQEFEDKKENSEDIVIPDNVTEEKKEQLETKKTYLQIFENLDRLLTKSIKDCDDSTLTSINSIYQTNDGYVFYTSSINKLGEKYFNSNSLIQVEMGHVSNFTDLNNALSNAKTAQLLQTFHSYARCEELNKNVYKLTIENSLFEGESAQIIDMTTNLNFGSQNAPTDSTIFYKYSYLSSSGKIKNNYILSNVEFNAYALGATYDELVASIKGIENGDLVANNQYLFKDSDLDWEEYKSQNEALDSNKIITDSFMIKDENGELEVFNYPAFKQFDQQQQAEKEAKELEQKMRQEAKVTYSEQELGF